MLSFKHTHTHTQRFETKGGSGKRSAFWQSCHRWFFWFSCKKPGMKPQHQKWLQQQRSQRAWRWISESKDFLFKAGLLSCCAGYKRANETFNFTNRMKNEGSCVPGLFSCAVSVFVLCLEGEENTVEHQVPPCLATFSSLSWKLSSPGSSGDAITAHSDGEPQWKRMYPSYWKFLAVIYNGLIQRRLVAPSFFAEMNTALS